MEVSAINAPLAQIQMIRENADSPLDKHPSAYRSRACTGDGTNAQFKKISATGTVMWEMVPGTLKNKAGKFIDSHGNVLANAINNLSSGVLPGALPNFPDYGLAPPDWNFWSPLPNGTATVGPICDPVLEAC